MPGFDADTLAAWTAGTWTARPAGEVAGFAIDTRRLPPGSMFVALRTAQRDGHDFLGAAQAAGAAAALVARPRPDCGLPQLVVGDPLAAFHAIARAHRRRFAGPVVGVTGSAGKTSTKELLARLLGPEAAATAGNLNNHLGVPLTLTALQPGRHRFAVVEAGISAPGEMRTLAEMIAPDVALVTLVGPAHLEELGGMEGVAWEKAELARHVRPGGVAIFPDACRRWAAFASLATPALDLDFTQRAAGSGREIELRLGGRTERYFLPAASEGMGQNAALAVRTARHLGVGEDIVRERLAGWRPAALRGEIRQDGGRLLYLDYYNANPASMRDALEAFDRLTAAAGPRLFVVGCMEELGAQTGAYHEELGRALPLRDGDRVLLIGEQADAVRRGAGARAAQIAELAGAAEAAPRVADFPGPIFVKGSRRHRLELALSAPPAPLPC